MRRQTSALGEEQEEEQQAEQYTAVTISLSRSGDRSSLHASCLKTLKMTKKRKSRMLLVWLVEIVVVDKK